jgi:two-component system, OmpR family, KDP operon response regulator KdpE
MIHARILIVDDDPQIRRVLKVTLGGQGFEVDDARNGEAALEKIRQARFDLVLLDINMPGLSGLDVCRAIRATSEIAIVMLTVRDSEADTVEALDAGADDYVTKPFKPSELQARIRAALRRSPGGQGPAGRVVVGAATVDFDTREVTAHGRRLRLTPKEYDLLRYLVAHANRVLSHRQLLQAVWGPDYGDQVDYLRVIVNQLRKKIEPTPAKPVCLLTEPWVGYRLQIPAAPGAEPGADAVRDGGES